MPTNTPLPTVSTGGTIAAATTNDTAVLNTCVGLLNIGSVLAGSPPATNAPNFQIQAGTTAISCSSGNWLMPFPVSFPGGLIAATITPDEGGGNIDVVVLTRTLSNAGGLEGQFFRNGSALSGTPVISWIAIGF